VTPVGFMQTSLVIISALGAAQALFLALALAARSVHRTANRLLALLLLAMALYLANGAYHAADLVAWWPGFFRWAHPIPLLFGPLLYLYARVATDSTRRLRWRDLAHALPFVAVLAWSLPVYLLSAADTLALHDAIGRGSIPPAIARNLEVSGWLKLLSGVVYTVLTMRLLQRHHRALRERYSTLDRMTLDWLLVLVAASVLVWGIAVAAQFGESAGLVRAGIGDHLIVLLMAVATYLIGYRGLQQAIVPVADTLGEVAVEATAPSRSERSLLSTTVARTLEERLARVMRDDQPWRDADLTLGDLAARVGTTPHKLSELLNTRIEHSFHDYVNGFRVREVQRLLLRPESSARTLLALALEAGFASKSTFNAVFRREVGQAPSAWRAAQTASEVQTDPSGRPAR
jgi:AraC-like DNA-binding protein